MKAQPKQSRREYWGIIFISDCIYIWIFCFVLPENILLKYNDMHCRWYSIGLQHILRSRYLFHSSSSLVLIDTHRWVSQLVWVCAMVPDVCRFYFYFPRCYLNLAGKLERQKLIKIKFAARGKSEILWLVEMSNERRCFLLHCGIEYYSPNFNDDEKKNRMATIKHETKTKPIDR